MVAAGQQDRFFNKSYVVVTSDDEDYFQRLKLVDYLRKVDVHLSQCLTLLQCTVQRHGGPRENESSEGQDAGRSIRLEEAIMTVSNMTAFNVSNINLRLLALEELECFFYLTKWRTAAAFIKF